MNTNRTRTKRKRSIFFPPYWFKPNHLNYRLERALRGLKGFSSHINMKYISSYCSGHGASSWCIRIQLASCEVQLLGTSGISDWAVAQSVMIHVTVLHNTAVNVALDKSFCQINISERNVQVLYVSLHVSYFHGCCFELGPGWCNQDKSSVVLVIRLLFCLCDTNIVDTVHCAVISFMAMVLWFFLLGGGGGWTPWSRLIIVCGYDTKGRCREPG